MKRYLLLFAVSMMSLVLINTAHGQAPPVTITVVPSISPNFNGSLNFGGYAYNAITALSGGLTGLASNPLMAPGTEGTPAAQYSASGSTVNTSNVIATGFQSWKGTAPPPGAFAGERGNNLRFGASLVSNAPGVTQFALSDVRFDIATTDGFLFSDNMGVPLSNQSFVGDYNANRVGIQSVDGIFGNGNDVLITSGANTQLVDALYLVGFGDAYPDSAFTPGATDQETINNGLQEIGPTSSFTGANYSLTQTFNGGVGGGPGVIGQNPANVLLAVPEPASMAVLGAGLFGLFGYTYRRRRNNNATA